MSVFGLIRLVILSVCQFVCLLVHRSTGRSVSQLVCQLVVWSFGPSTVSPSVYRGIFNYSVRRLIWILSVCPQVCQLVWFVFFVRWSTDRSVSQFVSQSVLQSFRPSTISQSVFRGVFNNSVLRLIWILSVGP